MAQPEARRILNRPVDTGRDHVLGAPQAPLTLVEYGSYACPHCRAANEQIAGVRDRFGGRLRYVFRHRPLTGSELARRAAVLAECADAKGHFWDAHMQLMTRSESLTEDDLRAVAEACGLAPDDELQTRNAQDRVIADELSAKESGVRFTPTFFINGRRYDGPWDEVSLSDALLNTLGHRVRAAALDFASWGPSAGVLLLLATVLAIALSNSPVGPAFAEFWHRELGFNFGQAGFSLSLQHWVNDALLTIFFLVVGLEIKREFTIGHLAGRRSAALPVAAAIGGMAVPAAIYSLIIPAGDWSLGWGVPMATDTAFAVALIAMMGSRVPVELRIFLTAAAIVDDIGAIIVVALFYSGELQWAYLGAAVLTTAALAFLNRSHIYRLSPYMFLGLALWICVYQGGLHATLAGVVLAMFIPTRPPPNLRALTVQADALIAAEAQRGADVLRHGPSLPALQALDAIHDRIESPADRLLRHAGERSSYLVLPVFALANAGVVWSSGVLQGNEPLMLAIIAGLVIGKPLGIVGASALAVSSGLAEKPGQYSWLQVTGAGLLAGIGFTMSLFIAGQAFPAETHFAAAKIAVFAASVLSAVMGVFMLWYAARAGDAGGGAAA